MNKLSLGTLVVLLFSFTSACNYSFSGASISPDVQTVSISYFPNEAPIVAPTLSQVLTEKLKTKFITDTRLSLVQEEGDLQFSGKITGYNTAPVAVQGNQTTALNRLTMTLKVTFTNMKDPSKNYESSFSNFVDFESSQNFASVESSLIEEVTDMAVQDIFNKAVINW